MTRHFTSRDFARVPSALTAAVPERLAHPRLLEGGSKGEEGFSAERGHLVRIADLPSKTMSMTLGGLSPGQTTRLHRHNYETLIYILEGSGRSFIGDREVEWQAGDAVFIPAWVWHRHWNGSRSERALYIACENAPLLQNMGIAVREEA